MTQIAKRYLDEIEEICQSDGELPIGDVVHHFWGRLRNNHLFGFAKYDCLTQIRKENRINRKGITDRFDDIDPTLTQELLDDERIAKEPLEILPKHLRHLTELTEEQKQEVRDTLMPYAEWQTRLRLYYQDVPVNELELQDVPNKKNFYDQVRKAIKDNPQPLFALMQFVLAETNAEMQTMFNKTMTDYAGHLKQSVPELKTGNLPMLADMRQCANICKLTSELMTAFEQIYVDLPDYGKKNRRLK